VNEFLPSIQSSINDSITSLNYFLPELVLVISFLVVILADLFLSKKYKHLTFTISLLAVVITSYFVIGQLAFPVPLALFNDTLTLSRLSANFKMLFCLVNILFLVFARFNHPLQAHSKGIGDLFSIALAVQLGLHLMAMSSNLLMIYISVEMVSVGSYLMVGYLAGNTKQTEAAMKYALFGAVCSAIMLYGISLLYGFTGTLNIQSAEFISGLKSISLLSSGVPLVMVLVGIGFKLSFAPLHFWSPDVYEGAPTPVTAFLSTGPKIAGFAVLISMLAAFRQTNHSFEFQIFDFNALLSVAAIASMIIGNFGAIWQTNVKRMLAYSSIGHTGFLLMAVIASSEIGYKALLFYLVIYIFMNMAAFMIVQLTEEITGSENINDFNGLGKLYPLIMICFTVLLVSLTGLPPTAGFTAKFLVFSSILELYNKTSSVWLLALMITGAATTVVSLFYYFKIPQNAFLKSNKNLDIASIKFQPLVWVIAVLTSFLIILIIFPSLIADFIN
jgi:NADH-quinone oxidoreductase subunit N